MKRLFIFPITICLICFFFSCTENEMVREGVYRGVYEGANQLQETKRVNGTAPLGKEFPTYDQYKMERQEFLKTNEKDSM